MGIAQRSYLLFGLILAGLKGYGQTEATSPPAFCHLIFNQDKYYPGDTAFFKVYFLDDKFQGISGKNILKFHLIDEKGKSRNDFQFNVFNGIGYNQVIIPDDLNAGHYMAVAYSEWMRNFDPPVFFSKQLDVVTQKVLLPNIRGDYSDNYLNTNEQVLVSVTTSKDCYSIREKVSLEVRLTDRQGDPIKGEYAISVVNGSFFEAREPRSLEKNLSMYLSDWTARNFKIRDDVRYDFQQIMTKYGQATIDNKPVPDGTIIMFYLQNSTMRYQTQTLFEGRFKLELLDFYGEEEVLYAGQLQGKPLADIRIKWDPDSLQLPTASPTKFDSDPDRYAQFMERKRRIDRSFGAFKESTASLSISGNKKDIEKVLGGADELINVQEYISFPTMQEFLKEVVRAVYVGRRGEQQIVSVKYLQPEMASGDPMYIIDGFATLDTDFFLSLNPADIQSIKIIKEQRKRARIGFLGQNGIILVESGSGDIREIRDDDAKIIRGLSKPIRFSSPVFKAGIDRLIPMFRSTLYWNPMVTTDSEGISSLDFYTTDDVGIFQIRIDGFAAGGRPFSGDQKIEVVVE